VSVSRWKAQHKGCQKAVDNVKADLTKEIDRLNRLVETLSRGLARYQEEEDVGPEFCRCGRPAFYGVDSIDPRCPGCEYMAAETCDCTPVRP
jgi:hypothetical protein